MSSVVLVDLDALGATTNADVAGGTPRVRATLAATSRGKLLVDVTDFHPPELLLLHSLPAPPADGGNIPLRSPWLVRIVRGEHGPILYDDTLMLFGQGRTYDEALVDYGAAVLDHYDMLREDAASGRLGQNHRPHLKTLDRLFGADHGH